MVDTSIIMQAAQTPNINLPNILQRSAESAAAIENIPLMRQQQELGVQQQGQNLQAQQQSMGAQQGQMDRESAIRKASIISGYAKQLKNIPMAQRRTFLSTVPQNVIKDLGFEDGQLQSMAIDDASIDSTIMQLEPLLQQAQKPIGARRSESLAGGRITAQELDDGTVRYLEYGQEIPADQVKQRVDAANSAYTADQQGLSSARRGGALDAEFEYKPRIAGAETTAKESSKNIQTFISEAVPKIGKIRSNIGTYDEAIAAIDSGANTGKVQSYLPSFKEASIDLENIRGRLGLDVISMATFGALSEGELKMALNTALPSTKEPAALRKWLVDKQAAQEKAAAALEDAVSFLDQGNSLADLVAESRRRRDAPKQQPQIKEQQTPKRLKYNPQTGMLE